MSSTNPELRLNGGTITSPRVLDLSGGGTRFPTITGSGTINANVIAFALEPGSPTAGLPGAGELTVNGSLTLLGNSSRLVMEIGGLTQGEEYDYIDVNGSLSLAGNLHFRMLNGFELQLEPDQIFTLLTSDSLTGAFSNVANGERVSLGLSTGINVSFQVNYALIVLTAPTMSC